MLKHQALTCTMVYEHPGANMHISLFDALALGTRHNGT